MANCEHEQDIEHLYTLLESDGPGGFWSGILENQAWQLIEFRTSPDVKIKLIHREKEFFVKAFAARAKEYAQTSFEALLELAELDLSIPILAPQSLCDACLVFPLGESTRDLLYRDAFSQLSERKAIDEIVKKYGLTPLADSMKIGLVTIGGHVFVVDPFQDDASSIFEFNERRRQKGDE